MAANTTPDVLPAPYYEQKLVKAFYELTAESSNVLLRFQS